MEDSTSFHKAVTLCISWPTIHLEKNVGIFGSEATLNLQIVHFGYVMQPSGFILFLGCRNHRKFSVELGNSFR